MDLTLLHIVGLSLVVIYAFDRFDSPSNSTERSQLSWKKYSTTSSKYYTGLILYVLVYIILYHVIIIIGKEPFQNYVSDEIKKLPIELVSALILTVLLPSLKGIKEFDVFIKNKVYQLVNIPHEVKYMAGRIENATLNISDEEQQSILEKFSEQGMNKSNLKKLLNDPLIASAIKAEFLLRRLNTCVNDSAYKDFTMHYSVNITRLNEQHDDVLLLIETYINSSSALREDKSIVKKISKETEQVLKDICNLISMAVISRFTSDSGRMERLENLGIKIDCKDSRFSWDMIAMIFMGIFALYFLKYTLDSRDSASKSNFVLSAQIAIAYCIAVFWAVFPKTCSWKLCRKVPGHRNYLYYLAAFIFTFISYAIVRIAFDFPSTENFIGYITGAFKEKMPYQIPSAMTALLLCVLLETSHSQKMRYVDLIVGIVALPALLFLAKFIMYGQATRIDELDIITSALAGALIFYNVPFWYNRSEKQDTMISADLSSASPQT